MEIEYQQLLKINYVNIQDKTQLQNIIVEHKATIEYLIKQIHQLTNINQQQQLQRHIVQNKMQQSMLENTTQIIKFKNSINQITDDHTKKTKEHQEQKEKHRKTADLAHVNELNELHKQLEDLEAQYRQLSQSEQKQTNYLKQIHKLNEDLITKQYDHHDTMNQQQKKQVKENMNLNTEVQAQLQQVKKNIYHVAKNQVIEDNQASQLKNNQLKARLLILQNQLSVLKKTSHELMQRRKELKINLTLNEQELEEYKAVGSLQKAKIKANKDKLQNLKRVVADQVAKREKKIAQIRNTRTDHNKTLKSTLNKLNNKQQEMKLNLQKMKILAQTILLQRQEVQQFFIMALEQCKKDIEAEAQESNSKQKNYSDKVDIEQLSPKDRQRILTNLYTKLALGP